MSDFKSKQTSFSDNIVVELEQTVFYEMKINFT